MMCMLESPYIVGYFDSFIDDQKINLVIEYCPNGDLNSVIQKQKILGKPFIDNLIWKIFINICLGLQYLHSKNIIHRDLKCLNIFMVKEHIAKIGDLGCAKVIEEEQPIQKSEAGPHEQKPTPQIQATSSFVLADVDVPLEEDPGLRETDLFQGDEDNPFDIIDDDLLGVDEDNLLENDQGEYCD